MHASHAEPSHEARRTARRAVGLQCELITNRWDFPVQSQCSDLSELGMKLETTFPLEDGDDVVLSFTTPHFDEVLTVFAKVRHVHRRAAHEVTGEKGVGLEFSSMSMRENLLLAAALRGIPPALPKPPPPTLH
jgi:hypothetical protein